jgi:hypothetical protein
MSRYKCNISLIIVLISLSSIQALSQQINYRDSLAAYNTPAVSLKPRLNYSVGSTFMIVPHVGTVTGFTLSPSFSIPLSPKLSVEGGIIAGRYYSALSDFNPEVSKNGAFNELSLYGSAIYHVSPQLTLYGSGIRQLTGTSPLYSIPKSSYAIGSTYNFGNFSVGFTLQMSKWDNNLSPMPFNSAQGFYSPYDQRTSTWIPFGR